MEMGVSTLPTPGVPALSTMLNSTVAGVDPLATGAFSWASYLWPPALCG